MNSRGRAAGGNAGYWDMPNFRSATLRSKDVRAREQEADQKSYRLI
jgi:hypothetical protein